MKNQEYITKQLRSKEFSMGNGQCWTCGGTEDGFNGHLPTYNKFDMGHKKTCETAMILEGLGEKVLWKRNSECVSSVCTECGVDLKDNNNWTEGWHCAKCGNWLITGIKKTYKEIKETP